MYLAVDIIALFTSQHSRLITAFNTHSTRALRQCLCFKIGSRVVRNQNDFGMDQDSAKPRSSALSCKRLLISAMSCSPLLAFDSRMRAMRSADMLVCEPLERSRRSSTQIACRSQRTFPFRWFANGSAVTTIFQPCSVCHQLFAPPVLFRFDIDASFFNFG